MSMVASSMVRVTVRSRMSMRMRMVAMVRMAVGSRMPMRMGSMSMVLSMVRMRSWRRRQRSLLMETNRNCETR